MKNAGKLVSTWMASVLVLFLTYGMFLRMHYSLDSYASFYESNADMQLQSARYLHYLIGTLLLKWGINRVVYQALFTMVLIFSLSWVTARLTELINSIINSEKRVVKGLIWLSIVIGVANVFLLEWFLYPETTLFYSCAMVFAIEAVLAAVEKTGLRRYILSLSFLLLSLFSYQAAMPVFMIYYLTVILVSNHFEATKKAIRESLTGIGIGFTGSVILVLIQKMVAAGGREANLDIKNIINNVKVLLVYQKDIWKDQLGFWPKYVLFFLSVLLLIIIMIQVKKHTNYKAFCFLLLILCINYAIVFAPHLITKELWLAERTVVGFWSFVSSLCLLVTFIVDKYQNKIRFYVFVGLVLMVGINMVYIWKIGYNHIKSNENDRDYIAAIQEAIEDYERDHGVEIRNIATCKDDNFEYVYPGIKYARYDTNVKCFCVDWGDVTALNYYTGRNYQKVEMDESIYHSFFEGRDWNSFNALEQIIFQGNTVYICFY